MYIGNIKVYGVIYKITNLINGKVYIGQTILEGGFDERYGNNLENNTHNEHLKRSVNKYGLNNFDICKTYDIAFSKEELDIKEDMYIQLFDSINPLKGYNKKTGGANGKPNEETKKKISEALSGENNYLYGKHHTDETKRKIGEGNKGKIVSEETKRKISEANSGKCHSDETKKKMSENHWDNSGKNHPLYGKHHTEESKKKMSEKKIGKHHTEESKKKMSESRSGKNNPNYGKHLSNEAKKKMSEIHSGKYHPRAKSVICLTTKRIFLTAKEGAEYYNIYNSSIYECCKGKRKSAGKYNGEKLIWKYLVWGHNRKLRIINN